MSGKGIRRTRGVNVVPPLHRYRQRGRQGQLQDEVVQMIRILLVELPRPRLHL